MSTLPSKKRMGEGAFFLLLGTFAGILIQTMLYKSAPTVAHNVTHASYTLIETKVSIFEKLGLKQVFSILFTNLISCVVIIGFPELGLRYDNSPKLYIDTFPRLVMFFIGFISLGLIAPPLTNLGLFLFFLVYLIPHGITELGALVFAFTIPREYSPDIKRSLPKGRVRLIVVLLIYSAVMETYLSVPFAKMVFAHII
ncbi:MAG: stage II sporulation protein M [Candidatus Hydrothermarchaeales archaeon]